MNLFFEKKIIRVNKIQFQLIKFKYNCVWDHELSDENKSIKINLKKSEKKI